MAKRHCVYENPYHAYQLYGRVVHTDVHSPRDKRRWNCVEFPDILWIFRIWEIYTVVLFINGTQSLIHHWFTVEISSFLQGKESQADSLPKLSTYRKKKEKKKILKGPLHLSVRSEVTMTTRQVMLPVPRQHIYLIGPYFIFPALILPIDPKLGPEK
jgi:hypothetical protein